MVRQEPCRREAPFNCPHCGTQPGKTNGSEVCICGVIFRDATRMTCLNCLRQYEWRPVTRGVREVSHLPSLIRLCGEAVK